MFKTRERLAEQQRLRELHDSSFKWLWNALLSGLACGLGNYVMGIKLVDAGAFGPGFTGLLGLLILGIWRLFQAIRNKIRVGTFIDYKASNLFHHQSHKFKKAN